MAGNFGEKELRAILQRVYGHTLKIDEAVNMLSPFLIKERASTPPSRAATPVKRNEELKLKRELINIRDMSELDTQEMLLYPIVGCDRFLYPQEFFEWRGKESYGDCKNGTPAKVEWRNRDAKTDLEEGKHQIRGINQGELRLGDVFVCIKKGTLS
ncbi:MAG: hypothetical protein WC595_03025 [Candidatus Nanoarchaeia archaeon]